MRYEVIQSGSDGNATVVNGNILVDCGVPYYKLLPYARDLRLVLLTHQHSDHFNRFTIRRLAKERPTLRWACAEWLVYYLLAAGVDIRNIDVIETDGSVYLYNFKEPVSIKAERLNHNVPNCGYHVWTGGDRLFYATDTGSLDGIEAKNYDIYMVEANYTETALKLREEAKLEAGEFAYETAARENHLSYEQAIEWLQQNMGPRSIWIPMHQHKETERGDDDGMVRSTSDAREAPEDAETFQTDQA